MTSWMTHSFSEDALTAGYMGLVILTLKATCLLCAALAATALLRRREAAVRHLVWVSTLTLLMVLPLVASAAPAWNVLPAWFATGSSHSTGPLPLVGPEFSENMALEWNISRRDDAEKNKDDGDTPAGDREKFATTSRQSPGRVVAFDGSPMGEIGTASRSSRWFAVEWHPGWRPAVLWVWLLVAGLFLLRLSMSAALLWHTLRHGSPIVSGQVWDEFRQHCRTLEVRFPVRLLAGDDGVMPMACGIWRSCILVPSNIGTWPAEQRRSIFLHELAHVARRDPLSQIVVEVSRSLYWFHPLVWLGALRAHIEREMACDDLVLNSGVASREYARHLLDVVSRGRLRRIAPVLEVAMACTRPLEDRIRVILDGTRNRGPLRRSVTLWAIAACVVVVLPLASMRAGNLAEGKKQEAVSPQIQRVRELIYLFRQYRVFSRDEEWARTVRELVEIGKPAVPELVTELDRTNRNSTLRSLGFTLRAIGDPRAVPALIRAIPKTQVHGGSDCGVIILDPELRDFMKKHQDFPDPENKTDWVNRGRPVNEILTALDKLTGHPIPHPGTGNDDRREGRSEWWKKHEREFPIDAELRAIAKRRPDEDPIAEAGLAKFGPLFPTGPEWRLGPVREVTLDIEQYANGKSNLDLDTGRVYEVLEGWSNEQTVLPAQFGRITFQWAIDHGIDARNNGLINGCDLDSWPVENERWDTLDEELRSGQPLMLGEEGTSYLMALQRQPNGGDAFKSDQVATFLFTTREGGRGILQVLPRDENASSTRLRYRMFESATRPAPEPPVIADKPPGQKSFAKTVTLMLPSAAKDVECLLDLDTGSTFSLPPEFEESIAKPHLLFTNENSKKWCRERGIDVFGNYRAPEKATLGVPKGVAFAGPPEGIQLLGREMTATRVLPKSFYGLDVQAAEELLARRPVPPPPTAWMTVGPTTIDQTESFVIRTSEGTIGILKIESIPDQPGKILLRYRLDQTRKNAE